MDSINRNRFPPLPTIDEIFQRPTPAADRDDDLTFERAAELNNPLAPCLIAALRKVRDLRQSLASYRAALKAAIESLHELHRELQAVRRRNVQLINELRQVRREQAA